MKIYLAGRFSRRHDLHAIGKVLQEKGHIITSRWTRPDTDHIKPTGMSDQAADLERRRFAIEDIEDLNACNGVVSLMEEPRGNGRGGRHIEFGYALALGKRLAIIGPRETVFHHMDQVEHFASVLDFLQRWRPQG